MPRSTLPKGLIGVLAGGLWLATALTGTSAEPRLTPAATTDVAPLATDAARRRIASLRAELAHHDQLYFQQARPEITDAAYDALKRELRALEQAHPSAAASLAQPPAIADDHTEDFAKVAHRAPMLSLAKAYTESELRAFCAKITAATGHPATFVVEPKIDGLSVSAVYKHGHFVRASTRGNGLTGDDITANARALRSLPAELRSTKPDGTPNPIPDLIELRGEIYLSLAEFDRLNRERAAEGEPPLAHPRNIATGTIKSHDPRETANRRLDVVFYGWGAYEPASALPTSQQAFHAQARAWGLPVLETYQITHDTEETWTAVQTLGQKRATLNAPTDGAVIKLDAVTARIQFGESEQAPRWAIAYKFPPQRVTTQLRGITIQVGRTGLLTPVAELTPVSLGGSTIARATLHNRDQIARLDLRVGDTVSLEKAGEIIPEIVSVDFSRRPAESSPYVFPAQCPSCGTPVIADAESSAVRCPNSATCPAQLQRRLAHFAGKTGVAINGLGEATLAELIASGLVRDAADLYRLTSVDLAKLPTLGKKSAAKLLAEIDHSRRAELWRFINGLGLPRVGPASAKLLARHFGSLETLAAAQPADFPATLGASTAQAIATYLTSAENRGLLQSLAKAVQPAASNPPAAPQAIHH